MPDLPHAGSRGHVDFFFFFPAYGEIGSFILCLLAALIQVSYCYITLFRDSAGDRNLN